MMSKVPWCTFVALQSQRCNTSTTVRYSPRNPERYTEICPLIGAWAGINRRNNTLPWSPRLRRVSIRFMTGSRGQTPIAVLFWKGSLKRSEADACSRRNLKNSRSRLSRKGNLQGVNARCGFGAGILFPGSHGLVLDNGMMRSGRDYSDRF